MKNKQNKIQNQFKTFLNFERSDECIDSTIVSVYSVHHNLSKCKTKNNNMQNQFSTKSIFFNIIITQKQITVNT